MTRTAPLFLSLLLTGCFGVGEVTESNWTEKFSDVYCNQLEKCSRGFFESEYSDMADCLDEVQDDAEDQADNLDDLGCDFDEEEAQQCLDSFHKASCEDVYEADYLDDCEDVFDCD